MLPEAIWTLRNSLAWSLAGGMSTNDTSKRFTSGETGETLITSGNEQQCNPCGEKLGTT